jgi:hypothetical protein
MLPDRRFAALRAGLRREEFVFVGRVYGTSKLVP